MNDLDSFFFQAEDGIRDGRVTAVQTCALPIWQPPSFLDRAAEAGKLGGCRIHASVPVIRTRKLADILDRTLPFELPRRAYSRITSGGGIDMAIETAIALAELPQVHALHVMAWGSEEAAGNVAAAFRAARGAPVERSAAGAS